MSRRQHFMLSDKQLLEQYTLFDLGTAKPLPRQTLPRKLYAVAIRDSLDSAECGGLIELDTLPGKPTVFAQELPFKNIEQDLL